ncbi:hypothetical protein SAMN04244548_01202 [Paracoccus pantotrophus]|nr:hypothetical protein SAMN04244548_01202 [Paracoccus pantotrophus]
MTPTLDASDTLHPSIRAAARAHGVTRRTVAYHLDTHGDLSRLGSGQSRPRCQNAAKVTRIGPHEFRSRVEAAKWLGISVSQFNRWAHPNAKASLKDRFMAALMQADRRAA